MSTWMYQGALASTATNFDPSQLPGLSAWIRGDDPGAVIDTAPNPDVYTSIPVIGSVGGTIAAAGGSRPQVTTVASKNAPLFASSLRLGASTAAAAWKGLHLGSGDSVLFVRIRANSVGSTAVILETATGASAHVGLTLYLDSAARVHAAIGNGSGVGLGADLFGGTIATNTDYTLRVTRSGTALSLHINGVSIGSTTISSPSAANPFEPLMVGSQSGSLPFLGSIPEIIWCESALSGGQISATENYLNRWS